MAGIPQTWIDTILGALTWVETLFDNIASGFSRAADNVAGIPIVGWALQAFFLSISTLFSSLADYVHTLRTYVDNLLTALDAFIDDLADLAAAVTGWISDKLDDAYSWATDARDWIIDTGQDLLSDVHGWISDKLDYAYKRARNAWDWVVDTGRDLWSEVHGWLSDKLDDAYTWATDARDWVKDNAPKLDALPDLIKGDILGLIAPPFNLVSFFFEDISDFFSDPLDFILSRLVGIAKRYTQTLLDIADKIGDALFGD